MFNPELICMCIKVRGLMEFFVLFTNYNVVKLYDFIIEINLTPYLMNTLKYLLTLAFILVSHINTFSQVKGYYRFPAIYNNHVVFTAEGDLWKYKLESGLCNRITTHHGIETNASVSPDGKWIAFNAEYEGPTEIYVISIDGGIPRRITFEGLKGRSYP
jgi:tricorn protease-like protein